MLIIHFHKYLGGGFTSKKLARFVDFVLLDEGLQNVETNSEVVWRCFSLLDEVVSRIS